MDRPLAIARLTVFVALGCLAPTALFAATSRTAAALATVEAAVLAVATAYAVFLGLYRFPR